MIVKIPLVAEIEVLDLEPDENAEVIAIKRLDEFRETVQSGMNYGITLYRPFSPDYGFAKLNDVANCFD